MRLENNEFTTFLIENCDFNLYGGVGKMVKSMSFEVRNNYFNMDMLSLGFNMADIECNYPEADLIGTGILENNVII